MDVTQLPALNATLNTIAAIQLLFGFYFIKQRDIARHKFCMLTAFVTSCLFLASYLVYHFQVGSVPFTGQGAIRPVYFAILISHSILAAAIAPLAIVTLYRGLTGKIQKHRRIARWTWPIWMYVSVTGVVIYIMLYQL